MSKPIHPEVVKVQGRIFASRLKVTKLLAEAGIAGSTWARWRSGAEPKMSSLDKLNAVIDKSVEAR